MTLPRTTALLVAGAVLTACGTAIPGSPSPATAGTAPDATILDDLPAELALPGEEAGATVDDDFYAEWAPARACAVDPDGTVRTTLGTDALRTAFRGARHATGATRTWQLGVYPDPVTAQRAYSEVHEAIDRCQTGSQSDRHPRNDLGADQAFTKSFNYPAGLVGEPASQHTVFVVALVDNAVLVHQLDESDVPIRDPRAAGEPAAAAVRDFLALLCDRKWWCRT